MTGDDAQPKAADGGMTWRTVVLVVMGLLGAATLVALIAILGGANRQRDRALELQAHSYDVMILARTLSSSIARAEASLGRYVISADKTQGQLYFDQWRLANTQIGRLETLTMGSPEQRDSVAALRDAYESRGVELSLTALSTSYGKNAQALARYYKSRQAPTLAVIDRTLDRIIDRERVMLGQRTAAAMRTVDKASRIAGILAVFGVLLVIGTILLGWFNVQAVAGRTIAQAEAEAERERSTELTLAVEQATAELRVQEAKLRQVQKMDAVGQLTGGIAHDFNNMLAVVLGGLELARRALSVDPAMAARHLENASDGANRAAALTRRLLAFSREDSLKPDHIAAAALVSGMSDLLDRTLGRAVRIVAQDDSRGWRVLADRVQLENAVLNLAVNARDAMNARGVLTITTGATTLDAGAVGQCLGGDYVSIAVGDTGTGMTPELVERVFEPFFTTKAPGKGTGLGLSQIFAFVRQLRGEIVIDTAPGAGTTVTLYLPRDTAIDHAVVEAAPIAPPVVEDLLILVVEDDPRVLAATLGAVRELGHRALACDDPQLAPQLLERHDGVDLVISDVLMPHQTGPEMIAGIAPRFPHVAVLFVTGYAGEAPASAFGDHAVLRKPYTLAALERAIGEAMTKERPAPPVSIAAE